MQPGNQPEDIHTILSRFHTWTGENPGNGNGRKLTPSSEALREIPYEEAMRNFRQRQKAKTARGTASPEPAAAAAALSAPSDPAPKEAPTPSAETAPQSKAAPLGTPAEAKAESSALVRRNPSPVTKAAPAPQSSEKKATTKKPASPTKRARTQLLAPVVLPAQAKLMRVQLKTSAPSKPAPRRGTSAKKPAALAAQPQTASSKNPAFKNVLARTIRSASMPAQSTHKTAQAADRNRRITTRFSTTEQIRLERAAAQAGLTVSAWLRQCALHAETASASAPAPVRPGKMTNAESSSQLAGPTLFSSPPPSGLGSWLTLLRQRFLSSPARFSERA